MKLDSSTEIALKEQYDILSHSLLLKNQIHVTYSQKQKTFTPQMLDFIEKEWAEKTALYPGMYNGPLYNLDAFQFVDGELHLKLSDTNYKEYVGTRSETFRACFGATNAVNAISTGMVLCTNDGKLVIGIRGGDVESHHGDYATIAGYMERGTDVVDGVPDPFDTALRELEEESGVQRDEVKKISLLGLTGTYQTLLAFQVDLSISSHEIEKRTPTEIEFSSFRFIEKTPDAIREFLQKERERIPNYIGANMILFGLFEFGEDWLCSVFD